MAVVPATALIPVPEKLTLRSGSFALGAATSIVADADLRVAAELLRDQLRPATGFPLAVVSSAKGSRIALSLDTAVGSLGDEGYRLAVTADEVTIRAPKPAGILHGSQTLRQLFPSDIFRRAPVAGASWTIPAVEIEDRPTFGWRGSHLDVGRHFMPKEFVLKHIDLLALHKLNVFHWHLSEDQGWRIEIKKYPKLTSIGAFRKDSMTAPRTKDPALRKFAGKPHGGFYTQDDVREVVRYAADRGVAVIPEIEMPGHAMAAIAAYPELGNTGQPIEVLTTWGITDHVLGVTDNVLRFFEDVLEEVLELFPANFVHIGGDECPKTEWRNTPSAQDRVHARSQARRVHGLAAPHRARRGAVVTSGDAKLGRLPEAARDPSRAPGDTRRELPRTVQPAGLALLFARNRVGARLAVEAPSPLAELLCDDLAMLLGTVAAEFELRADVGDGETQPADRAELLRIAVLAGLDGGVLALRLEVRELPVEDFREGRIVIDRLD